MATVNITQADVKEMFDYVDGQLFWKIRPANCVHIGDVAGGTNGTKEPYLRVRINGVRWSVHQIVFLWHHGYIPSIVDHIDYNIHNNRIENLRGVTKAQNMLNKPVRVDSKSGIKHVGWHKRNKKWFVKIVVDHKPKMLGYFDDLELASLVAQEAASKFHGQFSFKGI